MPAAKKAAPAKKAPTNSNLVDIKAQLKAQVEALAARTAPPTGAAIHISQSKKFKFPSGAEDDAFGGVIVDFVVTREYYPDAYDKDNIVPPTCFAISPIIKGMAPSPNSPVIQNPADKGGCDKCPMNQWESARTGRGKACKEGRKLAILPPPEEGENIAETPIWVMKLSPTALKAFDGYANQVGKEYDGGPVTVITDFSFDSSLDYPSVRFKVGEPNQVLAEHFARTEEAVTLLMVEPDVSNYGQEPPPKAARGRVAPKGRK